MADTTTRLELLRAENQAKLKMLAARGVTVQITPDAYVVALLEYLLGDELEEAQCRYEEGLDKALDQAVTNADRMKLLQAMQPQNGSRPFHLP